MMMKFGVLIDGTSVFFNDTATTEIYTLSLHDALPILLGAGAVAGPPRRRQAPADHPLVGVDDVHPRRLGHDCQVGLQARLDRKSTRLNSSHANISYAVFCLKKKNKTESASQPSWVYNT